MDQIGKKKRIIAALLFFLIEKSKEEILKRADDEVAVFPHQEKTDVCVFTLINTF